MIRVVLIAIALGMSACATLETVDPSRCAGPRRPANPYGSVLGPMAPASPPAAASSGPCLGITR